MSSVHYGRNAYGGLKMVVYELTHIFFRYADELIYSPKSLGLYYSYESIRKAVQFYSTQPGFRNNQDAFSARERNVSGNIVDNTVFEVLIYLHSEDYEFEAEIELGLYGDEATAQNKLNKYCSDNVSLINAEKIVVEKIVNKYIIEMKEWSEGFSVSE